MAKADSGLGWKCTSQYMCKAAGDMGTINGRHYYKIDDTAAIVVFCRNSAHWQPHLASTNYDACKFRADSGGPWNPQKTYTIDGVTWYFHVGEHGYSGSPTIVTDYPVVDEDFNFNTQANALAFLDLAGVTFADSYTVIFDDNGGSGTMEPQSIEINVATALSLNQFTKTDYVFKGWGTSPNGPVVYSDGEIVENLTPKDTSITLYAIWGIPEMEIYIQRNNSEKNKLDKNITLITTLSGSLKNETSIIDPVIIIAGNVETLADANYMTIPKFKRKYFITNIRSIRTGIIEISARVDVLSSFATEIRTNNAIVHKQENEWNLYLNDGTFKVYSDPIIETIKFPVSFPGSFDYVLAVAGGGSSTQTRKTISEEIEESEEEK